MAYGDADPNQDPDQDEQDAAAAAQAAADHAADRSQAPETVSALDTPPPDVTFNTPQAPAATGTPATQTQPHEAKAAPPSRGGNQERGGEPSWNDSFGRQQLYDPYLNRVCTHRFGERPRRRFDNVSVGAKR